MFKLIKAGTQELFESSQQDLYQYRVYTGKHYITPNIRSSYWLVSDDTVVCYTGDSVFLSKEMCVEIYGYTPEHRTSTFSRGSDLPYINGCSSKQLIPPVRPGDPTFQLLHIPAYTSEQAHHIHATPRVVYIASGSGISIVGTKDKYEKYYLEPGDIIILGKMVPHHFETNSDPLTVLPVHVYSTSGQLEFDHPMFNGTHRI